MAEVILVKSPFKGNKEHTIAFTSETAQQTYFKDLTFIKRENISTIKEHLNSVRLDVDYNSAKNFDYMMYKLDGSPKYKYAYITDVKYVNEGTTEILFEIDYIQTYLFDYSLGYCFVEREHVNDDTIGLHTIPEQVQLGEYVCNSYEKDENLKPSDYIVVGSTMGQTPDGGYEKCMGTRYSGIFSGPFYFKFKWYDMQKFIQGVVNKSGDSAITSMFLAPEFLIPSLEDENRFAGDIEGSLVPYWYNVLKSKPNKLDGYTPKNKKLLTFPYSYLYVSNGNGGTAEYHYEYFKESDGTNGSCNFKVIGSLTPGCSIRLIPQYYKGVVNNEGEGINLGKYPQCNWATDQYTNWLTQNGCNIATQLVGAGVSIAGGIASGGLGLAVAGSSISGIASTLYEMYKTSRIPPQTSGNINCGDVVASNGDNTFHFYQMSIKKEYAKIIDEYFNKFGYKVNMVKIPNKNHRQYWWYTKTIDTHIKGDIPVEASKKIKERYENGITFWRSSLEYMNYSLANTIK